MKIMELCTLIEVLDRYTCISIEGIEDDMPDMVLNFRTKKWELKLQTLTTPDHITTMEKFRDMKDLYYTPNGLFHHQLHGFSLVKTECYQYFRKHPEAQKPFKDRVLVIQVCKNSDPRPTRFRERKHRQTRVITPKNPIKKSSTTSE